MPRIQKVLKMREYLNNPGICQNMPEAEPKITVLAR